MSNRFLELATAGDFSYCGVPGYCTKCLWRFHRDFINPIEEARGELPTDLTKVQLHEFLLRRGWREHLADELLTLSIPEFLRLQYWNGHLRMAFFCLRDHDLQALVLRRWLTTFSDDVHFGDVVVFYLVKPAHVGTDIGDAWIKKAVALAERTQDASLVESLIWTLGRSASAHTGLFTLATEMGQRSPSIAKALFETSASQATH
jgi:hypothetical protein